MKRITKQAAYKLFAAGKPIILCPCKMRPVSYWYVAPTMEPYHWLENAEYYNPETSYGGANAVWKGSLEKTAWDLAYNAWANYNTNNEMGYYAHYYTL